MIEETPMGYETFGLGREINRLLASVLNQRLRAADRLQNRAQCEQRERPVGFVDEPLHSVGLKQ